MGRTCRRHGVKDIATYGDCPKCIKELAARSVAKYRPKGTMCAGCNHHAFLCTGLKFSEMPVIGKDDDGTLVVKCTEYEKRNDAIDA